MTYTLFVRPLNHLSDDFIKRLFSEHGRVLDVHIPRSFPTKKRQGFGYIKYDDKHAAARAINALHGTVVNGHSIEVVWADQNRKTPEEMEERKRQKKEEWLKSNPLELEKRGTEKNRTRKDVPLHEQFFTAVDYPPGIGEEFTPVYQRNLPPIGMRRQFFSWIFIPEDVKEKILKEEQEKELHRLQGMKREEPE